MPHPYNSAWYNLNIQELKFQGPPAQLADYLRELPVSVRNNALSYAVQHNHHTYIQAIMKTGVSYTAWQQAIMAAALRRPDHKTDCIDQLLLYAPVTSPLPAPRLMRALGLDRVAQAIIDVRDGLRRKTALYKVNQEKSMDYRIVETVLVAAVTTTATMRWRDLPLSLAAGILHHGVATLRNANREGKLRRVLYDAQPWK